MLNIKQPVKWQNQDSIPGPSETKGTDLSPNLYPPSPRSHIAGEKTKEWAVFSAPTQALPPSSGSPALLPELSDGGGEVAGVESAPQALVLAQSVLHAMGRVPGVVAVRPGQL